MATTASSSSSIIRFSSISIILLRILLSSLASASPIPYSDHCAAVLPESAASEDALDPAAAAASPLSSGIFSNADSILGGGSSSDGERYGSFFFRRRSLLPTRTPGVFQIVATLSLRSGRGFSVVRGRHVLERSSTEFHQVRPRLPHTTFAQRGLVRFDLSGYWSEAAGKVCMVGTGLGRSAEGKSLRLSAVFKLDYPKVTNISSSLIKGSLESLDAVGSSNHFDRISILSYASGNYRYTQISQAKESCAGANGKESLGLVSGSFCYYIQSLSRVRFQLDYGKNCTSGFCGPFPQSSGFTPSILVFSQIQCSADGMVHMYVGFSNISSFYFRSLFIPGKALVSEGTWDHETNQLCLVACRIQSLKDSLMDSTVDACAIRICLWFPAVWSIEHRSTAVGRIWSNVDEKDSGYFDLVSFWSTDNYIGSLPGLKYNYTRMELVRKSCANNSSRSVGKRRYPDGKSFRDFKFDASMRNSEGKTTWGYFTPVSIGQTIYGNLFGQNGVPLPLVAVHESSSLQNISYDIHFMFSNTSLSMNSAEKISAEGTYEAKTGLLCLVGCRHVSSFSSKQQTEKSESMDCGIVINIQLAPLNPKAGDKLTGEIWSKRDKTDPLFFEPLQITSLAIYRDQAIQSMWRMDVEITMVMVSLTLSCIFIGLQLFYVKKNPEVLPSVSFTMLVILTLGHMIPLVLNFQALFRTSGSQNVLLWSGGWLEVNEVIVRVITMVAFLLQFRFLQLSWSARSSEEGKMDLWMAEKNAIKTCLPLYIVGGLIALFVHMIYNQAQVKRRPVYASHDSLWGNLISYSGLILDGFLLPQVIFNMFSGSKDKALAPSFYVGNTVVRALPHAYDAYRRSHYLPRFNSSYLYARPYEGFYSLVWDIIIPCGGVLLSVLIYLQQRFGGNCLFPFKSSKERSYELVPVASS
ncbi:hypothetical protein Cni_G04390 [Canna indica]|uniref:RING-type E3 ubiquitin transferase n=1 Tax=Canna indica TaxID=4628 RepID=A0AAQ3JUL6_9LILI|nr:hypothetical protein Cni_G04390 [Canna indica]